MDTVSGFFQENSHIGSHIESIDAHPAKNSFIYFSSTASTLVEVEECNINIFDRTHSIQKYILPEQYNRRDTRNFDDRGLSYNLDGTRIVGCFHQNDVDEIIVWSTERGALPSNGIPMSPGMHVKAFSLKCSLEHIAALICTGDLYDSDGAFVKYWNVNTGEELKFFPFTMEGIQHARFTKNNAILVTKHKEEIRIWNLDGDCSTLSMTIPSSIDAFDVLQSGDVVAGACRESGDHTIRFWDVNTGAKLATFHNFTSMRSLQFSPQGDYLLSISYYEEIYVWDTTKEALDANTPNVTDGCCVEAVRFSPNGIYIAAFAKDDPRIIVWDGEAGVYLTTLEGHAAAVHALTFSPDSSFMVSISEDDSIFLWDMSGEEEQPRTSLRLPTFDSNHHRDIAFNTRGNLFTIVYEHAGSFTLRIFDISNHRIVWHSDIGPNYGDPPHLIRFSSSEPLVRTRFVRTDENVRVWDISGGSGEEYVYNESIHSTWICPLDIEEKENKAYRSTGCWIVSAETNQRLFWLPEYRKPRNNHCMDVHGSRVAVVSKSGTFTLLDMSRL
jgi:WD40 repeat protein